LVARLRSGPSLFMILRYRDKKVVGILCVFAACLAIIL
jgi:hypothetical protein